MDSELTEEEEIVLQGNDDTLDYKPKDLTILSYQVEHYNRVCEILKTELAFLDVSKLGCGKGVHALAIALTFRMKLFICAPKTGIPKWKREGRLYGAHIINCITYNGLRGLSKSGITAHKFLKRKGDKFEATDEFRKAAKEGLLIVFDECHFLKNDSDQLAAASCLAREAARLAKAGANVRIAALSGTPADKKENINSLFKLMGIILSDDLYTYNKSTRTYTLDGLQHVINKCNRYDKDSTFHITCRPVNKTTSKTICHELYVNILKKHISSSMNPPPLKVKCTMRNLFCDLPPEDLERMKKAVDLLSSATSYDPKTEQVKYAGMDWSKITESRREIDSAKVNSFCRLTKRRLDADKNCKVLLFFTYKRDMYACADILAKYNPVVVNGDISNSEKREAMISKFQEYNNECRVYISNPSVSGTSIDLDDTSPEGKHRRITYVAPSYNFTPEYQATGRTLRKTTTSDAEVYFVYSSDMACEMNIINSMVTKSQTARDMLNDNQTDVVFPGELEEVYEKDLISE